MPYFHWRGVELTGELRRGKSFAVNQQALDALLFRRNIALLQSKQARIVRVLHPIRAQHVAIFYDQLSALVSAGVLLPDALQIVAAQLDHIVLQQHAYEVAYSVEQGRSLSSALQQHPQLHTDIGLQLVQAGQESGALAECLAALTQHLHATNEFMRQLRGALFLPGLTLLFFVFVVIGIFGFIIPYLTHVMGNTSHGLPTATRYMLHISSWLQGWNSVVAICTLAALSLIGGLLYRMHATRERADRLLLMMPLVGEVYKKRLLVYTFHSLSVLIKGGVPIANAVEVIGQGAPNCAFKRVLTEIGKDVYGGLSLSQAMAAHDQFFSQEIVSMIEVAQESGTMDILLQKIGQTLQQQLHQQLLLITRFIQPVALLALGILVAFLIVSVYVPLINMSNTIQI